MGNVDHIKLKGEEATHIINTAEIKKKFNSIWAYHDKITHKTRANENWRQKSCMIIEARVHRRLKMETAKNHLDDGYEDGVYSRRASVVEGYALSRSK